MTLPALDYDTLISPPYGELGIRVAPGAIHHWTWTAPYRCYVGGLMLAADAVEDLVVEDLALGGRLLMPYNMSWLGPSAARWRWPTFRADLVRPGQQIRADLRNINGADALFVRLALAVWRCNDNAGFESAPVPVWCERLAL